MMILTPTINSDSGENPLGCRHRYNTRLFKLSDGSYELRLAGAQAAEVKEDRLQDGTLLKVPHLCTLFPCMVILFAWLVVTPERDSFMMGIRRQDVSVCKTC
jgi:hypothetical protein